MPQVRFGNRDAVISKMMDSFELGEKKKKVEDGGGLNCGRVLSLNCETVFFIFYLPHFLVSPNPKSLFRFPPPPFLSMIDGPFRI